MSHIRFAYEYFDFFLSVRHFCYFRFTPKNSFLSYDNFDNFFKKLH